MIMLLYQMPGDCRDMLFYIVYYFCQRGHENLYEMTKDTFQLIVENGGTEYLIQAIDKADKNHRPQDTSATNQGRMYGNSGKKIQYLSKMTCNIINTIKLNKKLKIPYIYLLTEMSLCAIQVWHLYTSKFNPNINAFWQKPRQVTIFYDDTEWYEGNVV